MKNTHKNHIKVHLNLLKHTAITPIEISWSNNLFIHFWKRFWFGQIIITNREFSKLMQFHTNKHIKEHSRLINKKK